MSLFGVVFPTISSLIPDNQFTQIDPTHWTIDVTSQISTLKEIAIFLIHANSLPSDAALGVYVSVGGSDWSFRGYINNTHPSDVFPLQLPDISDLSGSLANHQNAVIIGISIEPLSEASQKEGVKIGAKEDFCKSVGLDLLNFMQSFAGVGSVGGDKLLVPANILDQWFARISNRLKRDPDFLTRQRDKI